MITQRVYLPRHDWTVIIHYDSRPSDVPVILRGLHETGIDDDTYLMAYENLYDGLTDTGLTYTNTFTRTSVVVMSVSSSCSEFANTWFHELLHCAVHISEAEGINLTGEGMAYIGGELAMRTHPVASILMCQECKK